jgi:hypothetical protein
MGREAKVGSVGMWATRRALYCLGLVQILGIPAQFLLSAVSCQPVTVKDRRFDLRLSCLVSTFAKNVTDNGRRCSAPCGLRMHGSSDLTGGISEGSWHVCKSCCQAAKSIDHGGRELLLERRC